MAGAPWEKYRTPTTPTLPREIIGPPDTYKARDQVLQEEAAARAREDQIFQREKFEREQAKAALPPKDPKVTEGERAAAGYYRRAINAHQKYGEGILPRGAIAQSVVNALPREWEGVVSSPERREAQNYAEEFIRAKLRKESGASIPPLEMEEEYRVYFPMPGDTEEDLKRKAGLRAEAIQGLRMAAGGEADTALEGLGEPPPAEKKTKLTPEQQQEFFDILESKGSAEADAYLRQHGLAMKDPTAAERPYSRALEHVGDFAASTGNIVAGIGQGLTALPDLAATTVGDLLAIPADALGFEDAAAGLRNTPTIGGAIESIFPTPDDTISRVNRFGGQFMGGILGFPAKAGAKIASRIAGEVPMPPPNAFASPVPAAAQRQNIQMMPADVGGSTTRRLTAGAVQSPYGAGPVIAASERSLGTARAARDRIAAGAGKVLPEDEAGEVVRAAADVFSKQTSQRGSQLYERAHALTGGAKVEPQKAIQTIDENIAELAETPELNQTLISSLEKLKSDFAANGGVSVSGLRNMRTALRRESLTEGLRGGDTERRFSMVLDALKDDIAEQIPPAARQAFLRADQFWAKRVETIDDVLEPVLGKRTPKSGEDVLKGVEAMAQGKAGGASRLRGLMAAMPAEEANTVRATVISRLGQARAGNQDAAGTAFSPAELVTKWNQMSPKGKAIMFGNGDLRQALDDLVTVAGAQKAAAKYANTSNTAGAITANLTNTGLGGAAVALFTGHPLIAAAMTTPAIAQRITGKMMASPKFVRWLSRTPKDRGKLPQHLSRLTALAESNPAIANDVAGFHQAVIQSLDQTAPVVSRAAASPEAQAN